MQNLLSQVQLGKYGAVTLYIGFLEIVEQAAALRDRIHAIGALSKKQTVIAGLCADTDIWGLYRGAGKCCYAILHMEDFYTKTVAHIAFKKLSAAGQHFVAKGV